MIYDIKFQMEMKPSNEIRTMILRRVSINEEMTNDVALKYVKRTFQDVDLPKGLKVLSYKKAMPAN